MKRRIGAIVMSLLLIAVFVGGAFTTEVNAASTTGFVKQNGEWVFLRDGKFDSSFTGFAKSTANGKWYYAKNGKLDWSYSGLGKSISNGSWYYATKGELNWNYTGLVKYGSKYYAVQKGKVNFGFTGVVKNLNNGRWFYVEKGVYNKKYSGLAKSISNGKWYYVSNGELEWKDTGLHKYNGSWYYVQNGQVNTSYTGLVKNGNDWFYVEKGKVNFGYTGVASNNKNSNLYYVSKGSYDKEYSGVVKNPSDGKLYYVVDGQVAKNYTGAKTVNAVHYDIKKGIATVATGLEVLSYTFSKDANGVNAKVTFKNATSDIINIPTLTVTLFDTKKNEIGSFDLQSYISLIPGQSVTVSKTYSETDWNKAAYLSVNDRCWGERKATVYLWVDSAPKNIYLTKAGKSATLKSATKSSPSVIDKSIGNPYGKKTNIAVSKIYFDKDGKNLRANITLKNNTGKTITNLYIHAAMLDKNGNITGWFRMSSQNNIKPGATATIYAYPLSKDIYGGDSIAYFTICYYNYDAGGSNYRGYFPTIPKAAKR